jgi:AraC-like DNA-binding protein
MHSVSILAYDGMSGFESGLAAEIFGLTELSEMFSKGVPRPWYSIKMCTEGDEVRMLGGATVRSPYRLADLAAADTVIIPSVRDVMEPRSALSRRSYLRRFAGATGTMPIKWLIAQHIQASLSLLESASLSIEQIATRVGFESPVTTGTTSSVP